MECQSIIANQLRAARLPMLECKPSLKDSSKKDKNAEDILSQRVRLKKLYHLLREQNHTDIVMFSILYSNLKNVKSLDCNLLLLELVKLNELRLTKACKLKKFAIIKGRMDFPPQDQRVNYFRNPGDLDESMLKPTLASNDKHNPCYNTKLITCKVDPKSVNTKFAWFQSIKSINKLEVLLKETPILSYNNPACQCTGAISYRCHHCQKVVKEFYPCHTCDVCVFCDIECYLFALDLYHRWECFALQRHMFTTYQMMAMRLMMIGMQTDIYNQKLVNKAAWLKYHGNCLYNRVMDSNREYIQDKQLKANFKVIHFANKIAGYSKYYENVKKYYDLKNLPVNWEGMGDIDQVIMDVTRMLGYLARSTDLFQQVIKCSWRPQPVSITDLQMYAGGMLLRHYGEVLCNVIALPNLCMRPTQLEEMEDGVTFIIGSNLGRFHHSCEPNAACFLYNGEVIIRTFKDIEPNTQICFNYFGMEMSMDSQMRAELFQKMYFKCSCSKCNTMDYEDILGLSAFKCPTCGMPLFGETDNTDLQCFACGAYHNKRPFFEKEDQIKAMLAKATKVTEFRKAERLCNEIFKPYNPQYDQIYRCLHKMFVKLRDPVNTQIYFKKYMELVAYTSPSALTKLTAKCNFYFLQYFLDMCRCENFYDCNVMNMIVRAFLDVRSVYLFYYNIEQVALITDVISSINPLLNTPNLRCFNNNNDAIDKSTHVQHTKRKGRLKTAEKKD